MSCVCARRSPWTRYAWCECRVLQQPRQLGHEQECAFVVEHRGHRCCRSKASGSPPNARTYSRQPLRLAARTDSIMT